MANSVSVKLELDIKSFEAQLDKAVSEVQAAASNIKGSTQGDLFKDAFKSLNIKPLADIKTEIEKVKTSLSTIKNTAGASSVDIKRAMVAAKQQVAALNAEAGKAKTGFAGIGNALKAQFAGGGGGIWQLASSVGSLAPALLAAGAAALTFKAAFDFTKQIENTDKLLNRIAFASRTQEDYGKNMQFLQQTAIQYGLELNNLTTQFAKFAGATMGTQLQGEQSRKVFESVAVAASAMGLSVEQQQRAFLALEQIVSKGKVSAEELRGQLGEALPGAFTIAAKAMGVTTQEFDKMLAKGEVMAEDFLPKFAKELQNTFGPLALTQAQTFSAAMTRIGNVWDGVLMQMAEGDAISGITESLNELANNIIAFTQSPAFDDMVEAFSSAFGLVQDIVIGWFDIVSDMVSEVRSLISDLVGVTEDGAEGQASAWASAALVVDAFRVAVTIALQAARVVIVGFVTGISAAFAAIKLAIQTVTVAVAGYMATWANRISSAGAFIRGVVAEIGAAFRGLGQIASAALAGNWDGVKAGWAQFEAGIKGTVKVAAKTYKDYADKQQAIDNATTESMAANTDAFFATMDARGKTLKTTLADAQKTVGKSIKGFGNRGKKTRMFGGGSKGKEGDGAAGDKGKAGGGDKAAKEAEKQQDELNKSIIEKDKAQAEARRKVAEDELKFQEDLNKRRFEIGQLSIEQYNNLQLKGIVSRAAIQKQALQDELDALAKKEADIIANAGNVSSAQTAAKLNAVAGKRATIEADIKINEQSIREAKIKLRDETFKATQEADAVLIKMRFELDESNGGIAGARSAIEKELNANLAAVKTLGLDSDTTAQLTAQANLLAQQKLALIEIKQIENERSLSISALNVKQAELDAQKAQGSITESQYDAQALAIAQQRYAVEMQILQAQLARLQTAPQTLEVQKQILATQQQIAAVNMAKPLSDAQQASINWRKTLTEIKNSAVNGLANGLTDAMLSVADGTKKAKDAFKDFAVQFLKDIAKMIIQALILKAVKSAFGGFSDGGAVGDGGGTQNFASGGFVSGAGTATSDSIPARLSNGEFVQPTSAVDYYGRGFMEAIRNRKLPKIGVSEGNLPAISQTRAVQKYATGGAVQPSAAPQVNVQMVNNGTPQTVTRQQVEYDTIKGMMIKLFTDDVRNNGTMAQSIRNSRAVTG